MTAKLSATLGHTAASIYRKAQAAALLNARRPQRAALTCKHSPDCFSCPLADCAVELEKATATNMI